MGLLQFIDIFSNIKMKFLFNEFNGIFNNQIIIKFYANELFEFTHQNGSLAIHSFNNNNNTLKFVVCWILIVQYFLVGCEKMIQEYLCAKMFINFIMQMAYLIRSIKNWSANSRYFKNFAHQKLTTRKK